MNVPENFLFKYKSEYYFLTSFKISCLSMTHEWDVIVNLCFTTYPVFGIKFPRVLNHSPLFVFF